MAGLDFQHMDNNFSNLIYEFSRFILINEHTFSKLKGGALALIIKISQTGNSEGLGEDILGMMVDNLDAICHYSETKSLFNYLMGKYGEQHFESLFYNILDYVHEAKIICLEALIAINIDALKDFERYAKIRILKLEDQNKNISRVADQLLEKYKFNLTIDSLKEFDL